MRQLLRASCNVPCYRSWDQPTAHRGAWLAIMARSKLSSDVSRIWRSSMEPSTFQTARAPVLLIVVIGALTLIGYLLVVSTDAGSSAASPHSIWAIGLMPTPS